MTPIFDWLHSSRPLFHHALLLWILRFVHAILQRRRLISINISQRHGVNLGRSVAAANGICKDKY